MTSSKIYVSIDIETTGPCPRLHKVISIGIYTGDENGKELDTCRVNFTVVYPDPVLGIAYGDFEKQCWDEFMSKQDPAIIEDYKKGAIPEAEGWLVVSRFIADLDLKYGDDIVFVTDNPSFDISFMDYKMSIFNTLRTDQEKRAKPMRYTPLTGTYRSILCSDDMFEMLPTSLQKKYMGEIRLLVKHDHNPLNDAKYNYLKLLKALEYRTMMEKAYTPI